MALRPRLSLRTGAALFALGTLAAHPAAAQDSSPRSATRLTWGPSAAVGIASLESSRKQGLWLEPSFALKLPLSAAFHGWAQASVGTYGSSHVGWSSGHVESSLCSGTLQGLVGGLSLAPGFVVVSSPQVEMGAQLDVVKMKIPYCVYSHGADVVTSFATEPHSNGDPRFIVAGRAAVLW